MLSIIVEQSTLTLGVQLLIVPATYKHYILYLPINEGPYADYLSFPSYSLAPNSNSWDLREAYICRQKVEHIELFLFCLHIVASSET